MLSSGSSGTGLVAGAKSITSPGEGTGTVTSGKWHSSAVAPVAGDRQHQGGSGGVALAWGCTWQHPSRFPPCYGIPTPRAGSCPPAPTSLLQQHGVRRAVGTQGGLLCHRRPLLKRRRWGAVVLAGVWVRLEQGVPCKEITGGKGLGSPTHGVTHPAPHKWGRSHLEVPRMGSGGQGCRGRCCTAAAPTAAPPGPPAWGAVWGRCCLGGGTACGRSHSPKTSPS